MKESAGIAYSYISANCKAYGASADYFGNAFIHLHVPAGATPKDGPSAGITIATGARFWTRTTSSEPDSSWF